MKKFEIEKTKPTFIISVLKVVYWVGLVYRISNFNINENSQGKKLFYIKNILFLYHLFLNFLRVLTTLCGD